MLINFKQDGHKFNLLCADCGGFTGDSVNGQELGEMSAKLVQPVFCLECDNANLDTIPPLLAPFPGDEAYLIIIEGRPIMIDPWQELRGNGDRINHLRQEIEKICRTEK